MKRTVMQFFRFMILSMSLFAFNVHAQIYYLVFPFENIVLNFGDRIQSTYSFSGHPIIFCYTNNQTSEGIISWPFRGVTYQAFIPVFLKTDPQYEGFFADPVGTINIVNQIATPIVVSCDLGF